MKNELGLKAATHFRKNYKDFKKELSLLDFIVYSIIRGKNPEITVIDSNYINGKDPVMNHQKYSSYFLRLVKVSPELIEIMKEKYKDNYILESKYIYLTDYDFNKFKKFFDINKEELLEVLNKMHIN